MLGTLSEFAFDPGFAALVVVGIGFALILIVPSFRVIKKDEVGLVVKRFGFKNLRDDMPVAFIERRQEVQEDALDHILNKLNEYKVVTKGVYIQDVIFPPKLVTVLTNREVAHQEIETFKKQKEAEDQRIETEKSKGTADMQAKLAQSLVGVDIKENDAKARIAEAEGEATYISETGKAQAAEVEAVGLARAKGYEAQVKALGQGPTAVINVATVLSKEGMKIVPDVLVAGSGGSLEGLAATLANSFKPTDAEPDARTVAIAQPLPKPKPTVKKPKEKNKEEQAADIILPVEDDKRIK